MNYVTPGPFVDVKTLRRSKGKGATRDTDEPSLFPAAEVDRRDGGGKRGSGEVRGNPQRRVKQ